MLIFCTFLYIRKLNEEKVSLEYKSLAEQKGSCFDQIYDGSADGEVPSSLNIPIRFTMDGENGIILLLTLRRD